MDLFNSPILRVVVIEDDPLIQTALRHLLTEVKSVFFNNIDEFIASNEFQKSYQLMLLDLCHTGDPTGAGTISKIPILKMQFPDMDLVIQSGVGDVEIMRKCIKNGATKFILKDHITDEIPALLQWQREFLEERSNLDAVLIGNSDVVIRLKRELLKLRFESRINVLIEGETGTGKELCAQAIHTGGPFVGVNVSAIPTELFESEFFGSDKGAFTGASSSRMGHFEAAGTGSLFLDEIQTLSPQHQAKLLRVLETKTFMRVGSQVERPMKARIISASNQRLREAVAKGQFREDLYFRLAPISVQVPPLRLRGTDIAELANFFLKEFAGKGRKTFTKSGLEALCSAYDWPGNVRELRGFVRQLVLKSQIPLLDAPEILSMLGISDKKSDEGFMFDLKEQIQKDISTGVVESKLPVSNQEFKIDWSLGFDQNVEALEKYMLTETLKNYKGSEARERLKMARSRFYDKLKSFGISG